MEVRQADLAEAHVRGEADPLAERLPLVAELVEVAREQSCAPAQLAIAYTLTRPGIDFALVGARHPAQVAEIAGAAALALDAEVIERITRIAARAPLLP